MKECDSSYEYLKTPVLSNKVRKESDYSGIGRHGQMIKNKEAARAWTTAATTTTTAMSVTLVKTAIKTEIAATAATTSPTTITVATAAATTSKTTKNNDSRAARAITTSI